MIVKLLTVSKLKRRLQRLVRVYTCQNATLLEITCQCLFIRTYLVSYMADFHSAALDAWGGGDWGRDSKSISRGYTCLSGHFYMPVLKKMGCIMAWLGRFVRKQSSRYLHDIILKCILSQV